MVRLKQKSVCGSTYEHDHCDKRQKNKKAKCQIDKKTKRQKDKKQKDKDKMGCLIPEQ